MKRTTCAILVLTLLFIMGTSAMAEDIKLKDTILKLDYNPIKINLPDCTTQIAVVKFTESSPINQIGKSQIFRYLPSIDVGTWIGKAVYSQLKSQGLNVEYYETMDEAGDMFIITGIANKVFINRPGQLEMEYKIQFDGMVSKNNKLLFAQNYISKQEKDMLNTGDNAGKLMAGLHDTFPIFLPQALKIINEN
ncbi:hypothetical protein [Maridesulfovibrio zosterae]|uniref:hypothetical protein n=1 Tax=Maridesulfovibrio zosterae TaxID=82171 RepID=UPI00042579A8|nr:hypothetical protein [Maridesulfovibrio zosterae]